MMKKWFYLIPLAGMLATCSTVLPFPDDEEYDKGKEAQEEFSPWQQGYLDIHQISTGRGNCTFMILPDGTTMMVDAGDLGSGSNYTQEIMPFVPSQARTPAEWIVRYAQHYLAAAGLNRETIDYLLVTHFHSDHVGTPSNHSVASSNGKYQMAGVSHVGNLMNVDLILDRDYPAYNYPVADWFVNNAVWENYNEFRKDREYKGGKMACFEPGRDDQIVLKKKPQDYPDFTIRNIYCNGSMWTGTGNTTENIIPASEFAISPTSSRLLNENLWSAVFKLSYGKFDYYSGGDALGDNSDNWWNLEQTLAARVGEVDVALCDHHAYQDATSSQFIRGTKPQVFIIPVWDYYHPQPNTLSNMLSTTLYPGERYIFAAGMVASNRFRLGADGERIEKDGHVIVRVYPGGDEYQIFVLNDRTSNYEVIYKTEKISSK